MEDALRLNLRVHIQGTFLLITLLLAFWYTLAWSTATIDDALNGESGAIVAVARTGDASDYEPLDNSEVLALQEALTNAGYDPGPLDGMLGNRTRRAIDQAKTQLDLGNLPDRSFLRTLTSNPDDLAHDTQTHDTQTHDTQTHDTQTHDTQTHDTQTHDTHTQTHDTRTDTEGTPHRSARDSDPSREDHSSASSTP